MTNTEQLISEFHAVLVTERVFGMYVKQKRMVDLLKQLETQFELETKELKKEVAEFRAHKKAILDQAYEDAERIREEARQEVMAQDVAKKAQLFAKQLIEESEEKAEMLRDKTREYNKKMLVGTHNYLDSIVEETEHIVTNQQKEFLEHLQAQQNILAQNRESLRKSLVDKIENPS